jgi:hypothetical protein
MEDDDPLSAHCIIKKATFEDIRVINEIKIIAYRAEEIRVRLINKMIPENGSQSFTIFWRK